MDVVLKAVRGVNANGLHNGFAKYESLDAIGELFRSRMEVVRAASIVVERPCSMNLLHSLFLELHSCDVTPMTRMLSR